MGKGRVGVAKAVGGVAVNGNNVTNATYQNNQTDTGGPASTGNLTVTVNGQNVRLTNVPRSEYNALRRANGQTADDLFARMRRRYVSAPAPAVGAGGQTTNVGVALRRPAQESSLLFSAGFTPSSRGSNTGTMVARLRNGEVYSHTNISRSDFQAMMRGNSPGTAYNSMIRGAGGRSELLRGSNNGRIPGSDNNRSSRTSSRITASPSTFNRTQRAGARQEAAGQARLARNQAQQIRDVARRGGRQLTAGERAQIQRLEGARRSNNRAARRLAGG